MWKTILLRSKKNNYPKPGPLLGSNVKGDYLVPSLTYHSGSWLLDITRLGVEEYYTDDCFTLEKYFIMETNIEARLVQLRPQRGVILAD